MHRTNALVGMIAACALAACAGSTDDPAGTGGADASSGGQADAASGGGGADAASSGQADAGAGVAILPANLIDDLDDGDSLIAARGGRVGAWYTYNDESDTGVQIPAMGEDFAPTAGGPSGVGFAAQTTGSGFSVWGAGAGHDFNSDDGVKSTYDGSAFTGIAFHARGNADLRVSVVVEGVISVDEGGTCDAATDTCFDAHGRNFFVTDQWTQYLIPFDAIFQGGWGTEVSFNASTLMSLQFQVGPDLSFEVAIDNVGFY